MHAINGAFFKSAPLNDNHQGLNRYNRKLNLNQI